MDTHNLVMPRPESVQKMLTDLLGKNCPTKKTPPGLLTTGMPGIAAHYVYDSGKTGALILCDLALSTYAGAALMLMPAPAAVECVKVGKLTDTIIDNVREVLNICASLFIYEERAHVRLREVHPLPGQTPGEVSRVLLKPSARMDVEVNIASYGVGKMALLLA